MRPVSMKRANNDAIQGSPRPPISESSRSPAPPVVFLAAEQNSAGTCPGGGRCNGTGGHQGCNGCPAYNNRVAKTAQYALAQGTERTPGVSTLR